MKRDRQRRVATAASLAAAFLLILTSAGDVRASASVEVVIPRNSYRNVRLLVLVGGRPQEGVRVEAYSYRLGPGEDSQPVFSLTSDRDGWVATPLLKTGQYHLVATSGSKLRADLYLNVVHKSKTEHSSFSMELIESPYPTIEQMWEAAEDLPVQEQLAAFLGTIYDPSGSPISGVSIEVARKGTNGKEPVAQIQSAADGTFSAQLPNGAYIAFFSAQGFRSTFIPFGLTAEGSKQLRVNLQIGAAAQTVKVTRVTPQTLASENAR